MLNLIKDALTRATPALPLTPSTPDAAANTVAGKRLAKGRTHAKVDALTAALKAARLASVQAHQQLGECLHDELDVRAPTEALKQADDRVQALEAALAVAISKDETAHAELTQAIVQASIETEVAALFHLKRVVAPKVEDVLGQLERVSTELATALNHAHVAGVGGQYQSFLIDAKLELQRFTNRALHVVTGMGAVPDRMMKYTRWSECLPEPDSARTRKR